MLRIISASQISAELFKTIKYTSRDQIKKAEGDKNKNKNILNKNTHLYEMITYDNNKWFENKMENEKLVNTEKEKFHRSLHEFVKEKINEE